MAYRPGSICVSDERPESDGERIVIFRIVDDHGIAVVDEVTTVKRLTRDLARAYEACAGRKHFAWNLRAVERDGKIALQEAYTVTTA